MSEKIRDSEFRSPFHLVRCMGQLAVMYGIEKYRALGHMMDDALDVWGDDEDPR